MENVDGERGFVKLASMRWLGWWVMWTNDVDVCLGSRGRCPATEAKVGWRAVIEPAR